MGGLTSVLIPLDVLFKVMYSIVMVRYFWWYQYKVLTVVLVLSAIVIVGYMILLYYPGSPGSFFRIYQFEMGLLVLALSVLFELCILLTKARENKWLKISAWTNLGIIAIGEAFKLIHWTTVDQAIYMTISLTYLFLLFNFLDEIKKLTPDSPEVLDN